ncbi:MAG TPA: OmpA family protein [Gammaproteobacteria bacterium]|nr:OmpA family protein [Gammaproteobacteria bacterium]
MSCRNTVISMLIAAPLLVAIHPAGASAASIWDSIKKAADDAINQQAKKQTRKAVNAGVEAAVECVVGDEECAREAKRKGQPVVVVDRNGQAIDNSASGGLPPGAPSASPGGPSTPAGQASDSYDFKAGERTLFASDFSRDNLGDFPRSLSFEKGNMEVVEWGGKRYLRVNNEAAFNLVLPETLPTRFTVEFVMYSAAGTVPTNIMFSKQTSRSYSHAYVRASEPATGVLQGSNHEGGTGTMRTKDTFSKGFVPVRIMADGSYVKVYVGTRRVANVPNAAIHRGDTLHFTFGQGIHHSTPERPLYIGDIRVAAGGRDLYDALAQEGRVAVHDILFDTGKATINPASADRLSKIGKMLRAHADLKLLIEGHTDSQGGYDANMALSKARADAVRDYLVDRFSVGVERLRTIGLGSTQPVADNGTAEGRARNRRVELVKL